MGQQSEGQRESLDRFVQAQAGARGVAYEQALAELRAGRKVTHWIWYVLPQLRALGRSAMAREFGIADAEEAAAYAAHVPQRLTTLTATCGSPRATGACATRASGSSSRP